MLFYLACWILCSSAWAQAFSELERTQGYAQRDETLHFIFDPTHYNVAPERVVVTGSFRGWSQDMEDPTWQLSPQGEQWVLSLNNEDFETVPMKSPFKYRINDGEWLNPPVGSPNEQGGNLVFMHATEVNELRAELRDAYTVWATIRGERPLDVKAYRLTDAQGNEIPLATVLPNTATETLISTAQPLDKTRVYFLEIPALKLKAFCSFDGWFRHLYSHKPLGAEVDEATNTTAVRVFAPRATGVKLYLYRGKDDTEAYQMHNMTQDEQGVWEQLFAENLHGVYYNFTVHGHSDPGNHFYETNPVHITDPYARVSDNTWGKARIWKRTKPATPLKNGIPALQDVIAYEVHVQDFTDGLPLPEALKGTFKGMVQPGLRNKRGEKIGFDYLIDLGINTVHLMPVQEYLHFPDDDWKASFEDDPYMIAQGINLENYQWGYRTSHFMAIEAKYRTKGKSPGDERDEFRDLVQAFHDKGLAVIIDIVPNHTAENMTDEYFYFNFNVLDKLYYYRTKNFEHVGEYGNEVKTENRPMVQRWLIDQCLHFIEEFGVDGFRIDLAGQIDQQTLIALKEAIGHDKILYGEPWIASNDPDFEANPDWDWYKEDSPITFFQDDARNAFKGPVFELNDKQQDRGWPGGKYIERTNVMKGLAKQFPEDKTPLSGINYLDIHDNFALADQFATRDFDGRLAVDQDLYKIAVTLLYTSLGPIVTHGGSEIMRSKGAAPLEEVVKVTKAGIKNYFHGKRDTYNHRFANQFLWETVGATPSGQNKNDYKNMHAFWKGMNAFRLSEYGNVFRVAEAVPEGYYQWITPEKESMLGYVVNERVFVLLNAGNEAATFDKVTLPAGTWKLIANNQSIDHVRGVKDQKSLQKLKGGESLSLTLPAEGLRIWVRE